MKNYQIPVVYQKVKNFNVEAENLQEAVKKALQQFFAEAETGYIEDSFEIDSYVEDKYEGEYYDISKIIKGL